jgi:hypothetical protein
MGTGRRTRLVESASYYNLITIDVWPDLWGKGGCGVSVGLCAEHGNMARRRTIGIKLGGGTTNWQRGDVDEPYRSLGTK